MCVRQRPDESCSVLAAGNRSTHRRLQPKRWVKKHKDTELKKDRRNSPTPRTQTQTVPPATDESEDEDVQGAVGGVISKLCLLFYHTHIYKQ